MTKSAGTSPSQLIAVSQAATMEVVTAQDDR